MFSDSESFVLSYGESCSILRNTKHRMIGITDTRVLEISRGKFDENDIHRFEDDYNR